MNNLNVLTTEGFRSIENITKSDIFMKDGNLIHKSFRNSFNTINSNVLHFKLASNVEFNISNDKFLEGIVFDYETLKNKLDLTMALNYKENDYIFTPYINTNTKHKDLNIINLSHYSKNRLSNKIQYISSDILEYFEEYNISFYSLLNVISGSKINLSDYENIKKALNKINIDLENEEDKVKFLNILVDKYERSIKSEITINEDFINFLVTSLLKSKIVKYLINIDGNNVPYKFLIYKFKKKKDLELKELFIKFLTSIGLEYTTKEYEDTIYINIICNPLTQFLEEFQNNSLKLILSLNKDLQINFINKLFQYTNNNFHCNIDTYLTLKELCYNNKLFLYYKKINITSDQKYPLNVSLYNINQYEDIPMFIDLGYGYLTKIDNIYIKTIKGLPDIDDNYLIVG